MVATEVPPNFMTNRATARPFLLTYLPVLSGEFYLSVFARLFLYSGLFQTTAFKQLLSLAFFEQQLWPSPFIGQLLDSGYRPNLANQPAPNFWDNRAY